MKRMFIHGLSAVFAIVMIACMNADPASAGDHSLLMATTTSTDNTGLLDYLATTFKIDTGIELMWTAVGTGKALALGQNCDVDVLLVHDPDSEKVFMDEGFGIERTPVMYNDFIVVGPKKDPAGIKGMTARNAFQAIAGKKSVFASRGDKSGTHMMELSLWKRAGLAVPDREFWYVQTGQGMLPTLTVAAERVGYTLTDRGTYIKYEDNFKGNPPLVILVEGDGDLFNQYSIIVVNPTKCANARYEAAREFGRWMTSPRGQRLIGDYRLAGKRLFIPSAR